MTFNCVCGRILTRTWDIQLKKASDDKMFLLSEKKLNSKMILIRVFKNYEDALKEFYDIERNLVEKDCKFMIQHVEEN